MFMWKQKKTGSAKYLRMLISYIFFAVITSFSNTSAEGYVSAIFAAMLFPDGDGEVLIETVREY